MKRSVIYVSLAALVAAGAGGFWLNRGGEKPADKPVVAAGAHNDRVRLPAGAPQLAYIQTVAAVEQALPVTDRLNARISVDETLTARVYTPLAGRVVALHAELGDKVKKGTPLVTLDSPDFGTAVSDLAKAEADAGRKNSQLARSRILFDGEVLARRDYESAEADARAARAEVERARLRLANVVPTGTKVEGQRMVLRSPMDGLVADRQVNPGTEVQPGAANPLFVVSDLSRLWLLIDLPEKDVSILKPGQPVIVGVDAWPDLRFTATVTRISPLLDPATRRVQVRASLPNPDGKLRPEMFARVSVASDGGQKAVRLPLTALVAEGLYAVVFVEGKPGEFIKRRVAIARQDSDFAYLRAGAEGGVAAGEKVVAKGALLLNAELASGS